ncbi:MAG: CubicO group peptidase (beta-lactamase class C family) [Phenylobacterium sp.]|jgi:CubicO group peptidase (beta-lactamase class C family)
MLKLMVITFGVVQHPTILLKAFYDFSTIHSVYNTHRELLMQSKHYSPNIDIISFVDCDLPCFELSFCPAILIKIISRVVKMISKRSIVTSLLVLCCGFYLPAMAAPQDKVDLTEIERTIERAMKTFNVPGVAVAIVKDDKVLMAKGFGVRKMGKKDKIDADTLFGIASNTKAFTTAALAILVDEGKLNWDDKLTDYLPTFQLKDAYVTQQFTVRDMLTHRSGLGLGAGDLMIWPGTDVTNEEIAQRMRYLRPVSSFRSEYAYDNLLYVLAGDVVAKASGMPWLEFVKQRILMPLKMNTTRMKFSLIESSNHNVATAHGPVDGVLNPIGGDFLEDFSSAGSIASNVNDMSQWLRMQLRGGLLAADSEKALFSGERAIEMWTPNTIQSVKSVALEHDRTHFKAYGLGWGLSDYHGFKRVGHTGGIAGMVSSVVMIPEVNLGVVILTNQESGSAFRAIGHDIVNRFLGVEYRDWVSTYDEALQKKVAKGNSHVADLMKNRDAKSSPSLALADYAQTYKDDWYGDINISLVDGANKAKDKKLEIRFSRSPSLVGGLEHYQHNSFIVRWYDRSVNADAFITFQLTAQGQVLEATMEAVSPLTDFSFDFQDLLLKPLPIADSKDD